jgi:hypothetical protein
MLDWPKRKNFAGGCEPRGRGFALHYDDPVAG